MDSQTPHPNTDGTASPRSGAPAAKETVAGGNCAPLERESGDRLRLGQAPGGRRSARPATPPANGPAGTTDPHRAAGPATPVATWSVGRRLCDRPLDDESRATTDRTRIG